MWTWKRDTTREILSQFPKPSRAYAGTLNETTTSAIIIATFLPKTKVLHILYYHGLTRLAWNSWRRYVIKEWPEIQVCNNAFTIEVDSKNEQNWNEIMGIVKFEVYPLHPYDVVFIGANLSPRSVKDVYTEFIDVQLTWIRDLDNDFDAMLGNSKVETKVETKKENLFNDNNNASGVVHKISKSRL